MKATFFSAAPKPKLVAVLSSLGGIFLPCANESGTVYYITVSGEVGRAETRTLEELAKAPDRTPVYEGDTIHLQF